MEGWRMRFSPVALRAFDPEELGFIEAKVDENGMFYIKPSVEGIRMSRSGVQRISSMRGYDLNIQPLRTVRYSLTRQDDGWWLVNGLTQRDTSTVCIMGRVVNGELIADIPESIDGDVVVYIKNA